MSSGSALYHQAVEHLTRIPLVNEREFMVESVGEALAITRRELYDDERFRGPPGAPSLGVEVRPVDVRNGSEIERALTAFAQGSNGAA
jgi:hypothetical protein